VFVADSHPARETANRESLTDLHEHLRTLGLTGRALERIPWVYQWNKRDVPVALPVERLRKALNPQAWPEYEAVASAGKGVSETLRAACKAVLARLGAGQAPPAPGAAVTPPTAPLPAAVATPMAAAVVTPPTESATHERVTRAAASAAAQFAAATTLAPPPSAIAVPRPAAPQPLAPSSPESTRRP